MNIEELGKKFRQIGKDTVTEVQKMNEIRQLNAKINEEKKKIHTCYTDLGTKLYHQYREEPLPGFEPEIRSIEASYQEIEKLQEQIREVRGVRLCPNCNVEIERTEIFCSNCGRKLPVLVEVEGEAEAASEDTAAPYVTAEEGSYVMAEEAEGKNEDTSAEPEPSAEEAAEEDAEEKAEDIVTEPEASAEEAAGEETEAKTEDAAAAASAEEETEAKSE